MRAARYFAFVTVLNAAACGARVVVGDLGDRVGLGSGGASQLAPGGDPAGGPAVGGSDMAGTSDMSETGIAGQSCASTLSVAAPPVANPCPAEMPASGSACDRQPENSICVWQFRDPTGNSRAYRALGCYAGLNGNIWQGGDQTQSGGFDPLDDACPKQPPVLGASCATYDATQGVETCIYPADYCECSSIAPGRWLCTAQLGGTLSPPKPIERVCQPGYLNEGQLVKDMGPPRTPLWCDWLAQISGRNVHRGQDSPGVADSYDYQTFSTPELDLCLAYLPNDLCAQNLDTRGSQCTATVAQLDDCVETILAGPGGGWVGHGCAPLLANPTCAGVIVQPFMGDPVHAGDPGAPKCVVPLQ